MDYDARLFGEEVSRFLAIVAVVVLIFGSVEGGYMDFACPETLASFGIACRRRPWQTSEARPRCKEPKTSQGFHNPGDFEQLK